MYLNAYHRDDTFFLILLLLFKTSIFFFNSDLKIYKNKSKKMPIMIPKLRLFVFLISKNTKKQNCFRTEDTLILKNKSGKI